MLRLARSRIACHKREVDACRDDTKQNKGKESDLSE
jgi:hypothetical protein